MKKKELRAMSVLMESDETPPVIGIVPSLQPDEGALRLSGHYAEAIVAAGGVPLILPLSSDIGVYETLFPMVDGFLLSGGQDINPERYGTCVSYGKLTELTPEREDVECLILSYAYQYDVPVLGICRGMQMINVYFGGTLYLDLADQFGDPSQPSYARDVGHWQKGDFSTPSHFVDIVRTSKLGTILKAEQVPTNSIHHQGVREVAPKLDPVAFGPDGLVEGVEVRDRSFIIGVQWHPEFFAGDKHMGCLFTALMTEALTSRKRRRLPSRQRHLRIQKENADSLWPTIRFADCI